MKNSHMTGHDSGSRTADLMCQAVVDVVLLVWGEGDCMFCHNVVVLSTVKAGDVKLCRNAEEGFQTVNHHR